MLRHRDWRHHGKPRSDTARPRPVCGSPRLSAGAGGERYSVQILDLSPGGAKLDCPASLAVGTAVILDCGTLGRSAVIRWQNAGVMGVSFDAELDMREAAALIDRSNAMAARMER